VSRAVASALVCATLLAGCAEFSVKKVPTDPNAPVPSGIRYSLPKPLIQVTPQADGTIGVEVLYLPDSEHTYAIESESWMSSYTSQVLVNQSGFLTAVEFKANTGGLGQQVAASAGAAASQVYNIKAAQISAAQTVANAAQTSLDTARVARDQAQAQLNTDIANPATPAATLNADRAALAKAQAQYDDAQQVLNRAHSTAQFASVTATSGGPAVAAATPTATPSSGGFTLPTWTNPAPHSLPENYGPVLFAVHDTGTDVALLTIKVKVSDGSTAAAQPVYETTSGALLQPSLGPDNAPVVAGSAPATFVFTRPVNLITSSTISSFTNPPKTIVADAQASLGSDKVTLSLPVKGLATGQYYLNLGFNYFNSSSEAKAHVGVVNITFTVK
jgi:hypothetical protein